jgi:tetratricopeptide (TPR) repeat protein
MAMYQLVFIDKSGTYLIIEGDELIIGDDSEKTFSNFYYSQASSIKEIQLPYYQKGIEYIDSTKSEITLDYCSNVMKNMIQTDITEEFKKEDYKVKMADLFSDGSSGKQFYYKYNNPEKPYWVIENAIGSAEYSEEQLTQAGIPFVLTMIGQEWVAMKNSEAAVKVYEYGLNLMPNNSGLYNSLGEIYFEIGNYTDSKISFEKSLHLYKKNDNAKEYLARINKILKD